MVRKITIWYVLLPYLLNYKRNLLLADFEKELKIPHQTISKYLKQLTNEKILKTEKKEKHAIYSINFKNPFIYDYLSISEKIKTYNLMAKSPLLKRLHELFSKFFSESSFLVFGSFAEKLTGNDLDLLIVGKYNKELKETIKSFSLTYGIEIHSVPTNMDNLTPAFIQEIAKKHIMINNSDLFVTFLIK
ncbi:MAG: hypothetical protein KAT28_03045 [Candidatus Aenigmarchaeota archaeon]|nr:hypothetical protein [Candidatus Aenigmarchaeota archaeon]